MTIKINLQNRLLDGDLPKVHGSFIFVSLKHAVLLWTLTLHQEHVSAMISLELNDNTDWNACNNNKRKKEKNTLETIFFLVRKA